MTFAEHGFTLVELMVVMTVIALASAVAVLAMPDPRGAMLDEAARFAVRARAAHDLAIVGGATGSACGSPAAATASTAGSTAAGCRSPTSRYGSNAGTSGTRASTGTAAGCA